MAFTRRVARMRMGRRGTLPPLRPGGDAQRVRVLALLAPAGERRVWRRQLMGATASRRAAAAAALGAVHGAGAVLILGRALLRDESPFVRRMAAEALGLAGGRAAAGALLRALEESVPSVRAAIYRALGRCGDAVPEIVDALVGGLQVEHARVCEAALLGLHELGHPLAGDHARELCRHPSASVRRAALIVAAHWPHAHEALLVARSDPDPAAAQLAEELLKAVRAG